MRPFITATAFLYLLAPAPVAAQSEMIETCLYEEDEWTAALAACDAAIASTDDPVEQGRFYLHRGLAHWELDDQDAAIADQVQVSTLRPEWFRAFANVASMEFNRGNIEEALEWAQAAIDAEPTNPRAYTEMLYIQTVGEDPESCAPVGDAAMAQMGNPYDWAFDPRIDGDLLINLADCLYWQSRTDEAMAAFQAADYLDEVDSRWLFSSMAYLSLYAFRDYQDAARYASQALNEGDPHITDVHLLITAQGALGQFEDALAAEQLYGAVLDMEDDIEAARNDLAWWLYLNADYERASGVIERWVAAHGTSELRHERIGGTWDTVAHIRAAQGDATGAVEAFEFALARDTDELAAERRDVYRSGLEDLGIAVGDGDEGLVIALSECAALGAACQLFYDDDPAVQAAQGDADTE